MPDASFSFTIEPSAEATYVRCRGKLVAGVTDQLYKPVRELIPNTKHIVIDMTDLATIDSMGLGTLVRLYVTATALGSDLHLMNVGKRVRELLGVTNLISILGIIGENGIRVP